jgi:hypothetical protein
VLVVAAFVFGLMSSFASAGDMPVTKPVPVRWSWTGLYIGGHAGAGLGQAHFAGAIGSALYGTATGGGQTPYKLGMLQ